MKRVLVLLWVFMLCGCVLGANGIKNDFLSAQISREQLAKKLVEFSRAPVNLKDVRIWAERLKDKGPIKGDGSFEKNLQVREVALTILEAITGESFSTLKSGVVTPVKEIVTCRIGDTAWRFHIADLTDEQYERVAVDVDYWIAGYEAGKNKRE